MRITRDNIPWIYTNYPEKIVNETVDGLLPPLGDNDYFLNQQTIDDTAAIFFSHTNGTGRVLKYGVQIYNNNASSITVTRNNCGFSQGWGLDSETVTNISILMVENIPYDPEQVPGSCLKRLIQENVFPE